MRIALFLLTNIAILVVIAIVFRLLGLDGILADNGVDLDLYALLVYSAVIGFAGSFISLALSKFIAKRTTGAQVIREPRTDVEHWLLERVSAHARAAGIAMPEVAIFPMDAPNAFATGARRDKALVAVSTGLLTNMRRNEVDAVLGHEIAHVANGDMVTMALLQGVLNTFVIFLSRIVGYFVDRVVLRNERGLGIGYFVASIIAQILLGILASMVLAWFSRRREFRADDGGARYAGTENMVAALERLKGDTEPLPEGMAAFGIGGGRSWAALFSTHPPLDARIAALRMRTG